MSTIHVVFKTHLDLGFTDFAAKVAARYKDEFIPAAMATAEALRARGGEERFIWTTGSWLICEFLETAPAAQRRRLERAIEAGDIVWHALPFTVHSELMDAALFEFGLTLAQGLDKRFGRRTIAAKMTDVPGHTRGIVPLLAAAGVRFLHIGVNSASTSPAVPDAFVWREPESDDRLLVMYDKGGYGSLSRVPGLDSALAFAHTNDNEGAQSPDDVVAEFTRLRAAAPGARVCASTMDAFAAELAGVASTLPEIALELGDTWIHGVGSDPRKVAHYRELCRLRNEWLQSKRVRPSSRAFVRFSRALLKVPEHTWGLDVKTHLADWVNYSPRQLARARWQPNFQAMEASWQEQRGYLLEAVEALGDSPLAREAIDRLKRLEPRRPEARGFERVRKLATTFDCAHFAIGFDARTGAIARLAQRDDGRAWADPQHPLALLRYQSFSDADYRRFRRQYTVNKRATAWWSIPDYTKPGIEAAGATSAWWPPKLRALWHASNRQGDTFIAELALPAGAVALGSPRHGSLRVFAPREEPALHLDVQWFDKPASRLPEALWLTFDPLGARAADWRLDKLATRIAPLDVAAGGNRHLHAAGYSVDLGDQLIIETLDAPLVAPGEPALLDFNQRQPRSGGIHFNLFNNVWGTNFRMWYDEDARFRFVLRF